MTNSMKDRMVRGNLSLTGSSIVSGGLYNSVRVVGEGTIDGDVECNRMQCLGTLEVEGSLKSGSIKVVGTSSFAGDVSTDFMKISGTVSINKDARIKELRCSGTIAAEGDLQGEKLYLNGELSMQGDCEADIFKARGIFNIGGLLNAGQLDIKLYRDCQVKEIGGERISVRKASALNPLNLFFRPSPNAILTVSVIEGDNIYLTNTRAKVVRGNHVVIGPGCEIELVEYKDHFEQRKDGKVREQRKV